MTPLASVREGNESAISPETVRRTARQSSWIFPSRLRFAQPSNPLLRSAGFAAANRRSETRRLRIVHAPLPIPLGIKPREELRLRFPFPSPLGLIFGKCRGRRWCRAPRPPLRPSSLLVRADGPAKDPDHDVDDPLGRECRVRVVGMVGFPPSVPEECPSNRSGGVGPGETLAARCA